MMSTAVEERFGLGGFGENLLVRVLLLGFLCHSWNQSHFSGWELFVCKQGFRNGSCFILLDPRMVQCILQQHSALRIQHQQLANEVLRFFTHMRREFQIQSANALICLFLRLCFERRIATQEFVSQYSNTPIVNSRIIGLVIDYLRSQVIQCTGYCLTELMRSVDRPAEISDLRIVLYDQVVGMMEYVISEENVLWLDVTMNYAHIMTIIDRSSDLSDIGRCSSFTESLARIQVLIHISTWTILQNHIHTLLVPKVAVHTQNVLVLQTGLDFNFTFNLLLDSTRIHQFLFNGFDGYNELGFNLTSEVHTAY